MKKFPPAFCIIHPVHCKKESAKPRSSSKKRRRAEHYRAQVAQKQVLHDRLLEYRLLKTQLIRKRESSLGSLLRSCLRVPLADGGTRKVHISSVEH